MKIKGVLPHYLSVLILRHWKFPHIKAIHTYSMHRLFIGKALLLFEPIEKRPPSTLIIGTRPVSSFFIAALRCSSSRFAFSRCSRSFFRFASAFRFSSAFRFASASCSASFRCFSPHSLQHSNSLLKWSLHR
jgi:hypothetical protein